MSMIVMFNFDNLVNKFIYRLFLLMGSWYIHDSVTPPVLSPN